MKIVINSDFGGFGLSNEAIELYLKKKGLPIYSQETDFGMTYYYTGPEMTNEQFISDDDFDRNDPVLVEVVEELGVAAAGIAATLKIIEIPDDVDWVIEDYDGAELVSEVHRTWG